MQILTHLGCLLVCGYSPITIQILQKLEGYVGRLFCEADCSCTAKLAFNYRNQFFPMPQSRDHSEVFESNFSFFLFFLKTDISLCLLCNGRTDLKQFGALNRSLYLFNPGSCDPLYCSMLYGGSPRWLSK